MSEDTERRMRDLNPRDFHLRVFETRALGRYANPPWASYGKSGLWLNIKIFLIVVKTFLNLAKVRSLRIKLMPANCVTSN